MKKTSKPKVYVHRLGSWYKLYMSEENEQLLASFAEVVSGGDREAPFSPEEILAGLKGSSAILSLNGCGLANEITNEVLQQVGGIQLICIAHHWGQFSDTEEKTGIRVIEGSNANTIAVAEWTVAAALMGVRKISFFDREMKNGSLWVEPRRTVGLLCESTVGLIGLGRIGRYAARYFKQMGCKVLAFDKYYTRAQAEELGVELASLETVLKSADVLSLHLPVTPETTGLLGAEHFASIKDGAVFINSARAALYDEAALIKELDKKRFSAFLDVYSEEPLSLTHPFRKIDNVTINPHIAGDNRDMFRRCGRDAILTLKDYFEGRGAN
ncbi:MAG: hydroxyacid dehydrogenase, partial [Kiritimatiellales bacterium]